MKNKLPIAIGLTAFLLMPNSADAQKNPLRLLKGVKKAVTENVLSSEIANVSKKLMTKIMEEPPIIVGDEQKAIDLIPVVEARALQHLSPVEKAATIEQAMTSTYDEGFIVNTQNHADLFAMLYKYRSIAPKGFQSDINTLAEVAAHDGKVYWVQYAILHGADPRQALLYAIGTNHLELAAGLIKTYGKELGNWQEMPQIQRLLTNEQVDSEAKIWLAQQGVKEYVVSEPSVEE